MSKGKFILIALLLAIPIIAVALLGFSLFLLFSGIHVTLSASLLTTIGALFNSLQNGCGDCTGCPTNGGTTTPSPTECEDMCRSMCPYGDFVP